MDLFTSVEHSFPKLAAEVELPEDPNSWPKEVLDELYKQVPYISDFQPHVQMDKVDAERAYGLGHIDVSNQSEAQQGTDPAQMQAAGIRRVRIPIVIKDGRLSPFDLLLTDTSKLIPLTESRLRQSLFRPQAFDVTSMTPGDQSLIGQFYPPFRQNYGFAGGGMTVPSGDGMGKVGEASKEALALKTVGSYLKAQKDPVGLARASKSLIGRGAQLATEGGEAAALGQKKLLAGSIAAERATTGMSKAASVFEEYLIKDLEKRDAGFRRPSEDKEKKASALPAFVKEGSLLQAIARTIHPNDLGTFWDRVSSPEFRPVMEKNAALKGPLKILADVEPMSAEKVATALPSMIHPTVVQVIKTAEGYAVRSANSDFWFPSTEMIDRGQLVSRFGVKVAEAIDTSGAATMADGAEATEEEAPKLQPVNTPGIYKVHDSDGKELLGYVIPNLLDTDGQALPLAMFTNGSQAVVQAEIFGEHAGDAVTLPGGEPGGDGAFYCSEGGNLRSTIPLKLHGSYSQEDGTVAFDGETYDGRSIEVSVQPNIQEPTGLDDRLLIPQNWQWLNLNGAAPVALAGGDMPQGEEEAVTEEQVNAKQGSAHIWVRSDGQVYSLEGPALDKVASDERTMVDIDQAMFLLAALGVEQGYGVTKLAEAGRGAAPERIRVSRFIKTADDEVQRALQVGREKLASIPSLKRDLLKEAAHISDPMAVDTVLSLGFINPENMMAFVSYLPVIDKSQQKLCELLFAARIGLEGPPVGALERAVRATEEVIEGLKAIAFDQE